MTENRPTLIPIEGQSFSCQQDWINRASRQLTRHPEYCNTAHPVGKRDKGWRGDHFTALCFDQKGLRMRCGADFQRAENEGTYPVWWIWPDQIVPHITQLRTLLARNLVVDLGSAEDGAACLGGIAAAIAIVEDHHGLSTGQQDTCQLCDGTRFLDSHLILEQCPDCNPETPR